MTRLLVLICLIWPLAASACSKTTPAASSAPSATTVSAQALAPPKPVPADLPDVLARVNGETIDKADFESAVRDVEQRAGSAVPAEERNRVYRDVLDQLIGYRLLRQEANARKIQVADADVEARINVFKQHFTSADEFNKVLAEQKMTVQQLREQTRSEMRLEQLIKDEVDAKISVRPKDLDDFYQKNPDQFNQEERVRASHILITVAADADAKTKEQARQRAAAVLKQVRGGQDFAKLAQAHSQDPGNAQSGGDLGFFGRGQMVWAFDRAAFSLKPGEVSDLVETPFGFHVIKVAEKQTAKTLTLDEVRPQLEQFLKERQRQDRTTALVASLKTKGKVEVLI